MNPAHQSELFTVYRHHAVFTNSPLPMLEAEKAHRAHAIVEQVIADLKNGPLAHLPSGRFWANSAWLVCAAMAFNLTRAAGALASVFHAKATTATIRAQLINVPGRLARSARRLILHLPRYWPWETAWEKLATAEVDRSLMRLAENKFENQQYKWKFIFPDSNDSSQPQDLFEWKILERFKKQAATPGAAEEEGNDFDEWRENGEYQYYQPAYAKRDCMGCHASYPLARTGQIPVEGDLLAVVKVSIPDRETQKALNTNRAILLAAAIITVFLAMVASYIIVRYVIVKPLKHLRDVSDQISHGNIALRAEIKTGDEFEELALAFNRMLRHLTTIQEELRNVNGDLDLKVDELAQANMRLYEMNRMKSDFLATMSHELRTPLNAIIGFSDVLDSIAALDDKQKRYVKNIQTSGKVLLEMINDILDLAKIESGKMEVRLSDFRIDQVVTALCDSNRSLTDRKNIDIEAVIEPGLPEMFQDQIKVQQILNNLLSNAIKFTPEGGRIVVGAAQDPRGDLLLTVTDTGVGIAEEDQTIIFEKFRQGKSALTGGDAMTREYSGTGLGLSIVKELCKLLGGEVSLESELGKGSTFTVRLPWTRADQPRLDPNASVRLEDLREQVRAEFAAAAHG